VVWAQTTVASFSGITALDPYVRAVKTIYHAASGLVSPAALLVVAVTIGALVYSMSRVLRRKRPSGHALFSF